MTVTTYHATFKDANAVEYVASVQWDKHTPNMLAVGGGLAILFLILIGLSK